MKIKNIKKSVAVLMSTFNGEKYLREQLDSILNQEGVEITLIVRDDGSSDNTKEILNEYTKIHKNIVVKCEKNIGVRRSFAKLILEAPKTDFYAFADQDDIWYKNKLLVAINIIENKSVPMLYYCNQNCVSAEGELLYKRFPDVDVQPTMMHTLFQNKYAGCSMVFNQLLMVELEKLYAITKEKFNMHDAATLLVAQLIGATYYDPNPYMDFRRHGENYTESQLYSTMKIGKKLEIFKHKVQTLKKIYKVKGYMTYTCQRLVECFDEDINIADKQVLEYIINYKNSFYCWVNFLFNNKLKKYFPEPKFSVYLKILLRIY